MVVKKNSKLVSGVMFLFFYFFSIQTYSQVEQKVGEKLRVIFPKNLAVFHTLVILTPSRIDKPDMFGHPLAQKARDYFQDYKNHPAVQATERIFSNMWYFPLNYSAFYHSDFPDARLRTDLELPPEFTDDKNMQEMITNYIQVVKDFYTTAKFDEFWEHIQKDAGGVVQEVCAKLPEIDIPNFLEDFYGSKAEKYYLVPCAFMQNSATHVEVKPVDGGWQYYHLPGGNMFSNDFSIVYYAFHEFGHSFIEPISKKYSAQIEALSHLYVPLKERFQNMGYINWDRAFNEHLITAGQLHLTRKAFGEEKMGTMMKNEERSGFKLIGRFYDYLQEYDANREKYVNLESFYPVILHQLGRLTIEEYKKAGKMGIDVEIGENRVQITHVVPNSAFGNAGIQGGDTFFSMGGVEINSRENLKRAANLWYSSNEGDSIQVAIIRAGQQLKKLVPVPVVTDYEYIEMGSKMEGE